MTMQGAARGANHHGALRIRRGMRGVATAERALAGTQAQRRRIDGREGDADAAALAGTV
jgi:hypothetical protein